MYKNILLFILFISFLSVCMAQEISSKADTLLFSKGIYLENKQILIPWKIDLSEISKYGSPKLSKNKHHRNQIQIKWDSAKILNGITIDLKFSRPEKYFKKSMFSRITMMQGYTDSIGSENLKSFFENYTHKKGYLEKSRKFTHTRWIINNCMVFVGHAKDGYFLWLNPNL